MSHSSMHRPDQSGPVASAAGNKPATDTGEIDRREFQGTAASAAMAVGLAAGYGTLGVMAVRFLFPAGRDAAWLLVSDVASIAPGDSRAFVSPTGVKVTVKRSLGSKLEQPQESDFVALSSVCPHLGCRVTWEQQNKRFFCPCHNGEFDGEGRATGGPPAAAHQSLPKYPLRIEAGLLYIEMPLRMVGADPSIYVPREHEHQHRS